MKHERVPNLEWGRKNRKHEDRERNLNARDRRESIAEQLPTEHCDEWCWIACPHGTEVEPCSE
jgi:hypothetical protein